MISACYSLCSLYQKTDDAGYDSGIEKAYRYSRIQIACCQTGKPDKKGTGREHRKYIPHDTPIDCEQKRTFRFL